MNRRTRRAAGAVVAGAVTATLVGLAALPAEAGGRHGHEQRQPQLGTRSAPIITVDHLQVPRPRPQRQAHAVRGLAAAARRHARRTCVGRMTLAEKAGLLVHGTLPTSGTGYQFADTTSPGVDTLVGTRHMTTFITRLSRDAQPSSRTANNAVQESAEQQHLGIPVVVSTDPRNGFSVTEGQTVARQGVTAMPDAIGLAAAADSPRLTRQLGDIVRQEYRAVGIQEGLSPQADLATEPRWTRINGTFGSDSQTAKDQVEAYVEGLQDGDDGLTHDQRRDGDQALGRLRRAGQRLRQPLLLRPLRDVPGQQLRRAPRARSRARSTRRPRASCRPTRSCRTWSTRGTRVEQVGAGFNSFLLQGPAARRLRVRRRHRLRLRHHRELPGRVPGDASAGLVHRAVGRRACRGASRT